MEMHFGHNLKYRLNIHLRKIEQLQAARRVRIKRKFRRLLADLGAPSWLIERVR
jgi:hypothetical protein